MPESRGRHKLPHHHQTNDRKHKRKRSATAVMSLFAALLGVIVVFIAAGSDPLWLVVGGVAGAVIGYLIGHSIDRTLEKKE
jgi:uncharacterized membrane protein YfcA